MKRIVWFFAATSLFVIVALRLFAAGEIISPIPEDNLNLSGILSPLPLTTDTPTPQPQSDSLARVVSGSLQGSSGLYGIIIKNLKTGETYTQEAHTVFETASLYKLWVMATVYDFLKRGTLTADQRLTASVVTLNSAFDIDPAYAEQTSGTISYTVSDALEQMITISHNYAALLLHYTVKNASVNMFLVNAGFDESRTGQPPQSTPLDIAAFFENLYAGKLISPSASREMLDLLSRQKLNDRIPKYLPAGTKVAHKTGELAGFKHDSGIVYSPVGDYIIVMLSKSDDPVAAAEREANLSKAVYDYFASQ